MAAGRRVRSRNQHRTYGAAERIAYMWEALETSPLTLQKKYGIPTTTLYQWFSDQDTTFGQVRAFLEAQAEDARIKATRAIYDAITTRIIDIGEEQLVQALAHVLGTGGRPGQQQAAIAQVHIHNGPHRDGEPTVFDDA